MAEVKRKTELPDFIRDFGEAQKAQLIEDKKRWGDKWQNVPILGQEGRIAVRIQRYWDDFAQYGLSIPWIKVANYALIAWVKENNPELVVEAKEQGEGE